MWFNMGLVKWFPLPARTKNFLVASGNAGLRPIQPPAQWVNEMFLSV